MNRNIFILFFTLLFSISLSAQTDDYTGTWEMKLLSTANSSAVSATLQIASPENNMLYPAQLKLQCDSFHAVYQILLVRKNLRQLGISRNKYPVSEEPFSIGNRMITFNGTLDYNKDLKGDPQLTVNRFSAKRYGVDLPAFEGLDAARKKTATRITSFLKDEEIIFRKTNNVAWKDEDADHIVSPLLSPAYFGLLDTIYLQTRDGMINFSGNKKSSDDIITVILNGKTMLDQINPGKKEAEDILVDTGLNIIALFADNFYKSAPNKGKLTAEFGKKKINLDFTNKDDVAATFIVAKLFYDKGRDAVTKFQNIDISGPQTMTAGRNDKVVGSIVSTSSQIKLALWDDAVEDGDSVSININGKWIAQGFPVKKNPQFITVTLKPGANTITFLADNLGSIPPNTSVLEIIDGTKRKSFTIETNLDQNNMVKIFYDYKPGN